MSQRLHIGKTTETHYDCVLETLDDAREKLNREWLMRDDVMHVGPWKIWIGDMALWKSAGPIVATVFAELGHKYPECVWMFRCNGQMIEHPTRDKLDAWLASCSGKV